MKCISMGLLALGTSVCAAQAVAQTDMTAMSHTMAANQLGVLEYCQTSGYIDGSGATAQKSVMARLPAYSGSTDAAEAAGKTGMITAPSGNVSLSDVAAKGNSTQEALCQKMADNVKQVAASQQSSFGAGGMPTMPAMPGGMPAMPSGMPAMPGGMPAMPGATPPH